MKDIMDFDRGQKIEHPYDKDELIVLGLVKDWHGNDDNDVIVTIDEWQTVVTFYRWEFE